MEDQQFLLEGGRFRHAGYTELELLLEIANTDWRALRPVSAPTPPEGWQSNVVLFDEGYGLRRLVLDRFVRGGVDVLLIVGCSGGVSVVDEAVRACRHAGACMVVEINPPPSGGWEADVSIKVSAGEGLEALDGRLAGTDGDESSRPRPRR